MICATLFWMQLKSEVKWSVDWINFAWSKEQQQALLNTRMTLWFLQKAGDFFTVCHITRRRSVQGVGGCVSKWVRMRVRICLLVTLFLKLLQSKWHRLPRGCNIHSRILFIWHPWDHTGARLSNIPGYETIPKSLEVIF
jgi:hypothetical protein